MCDLTNTIKPPIQYIYTDYTDFVSAMRKISIFPSTILSKSPNLFLMEMIFRYEKQPYKDGNVVILSKEH